ncbi:MAG: hypothetical protein JWP25_4406 [Bradyrhizobium sp.]|nr:hypothetical protein [Bradyrhizobium sp.]
MAISKWVLLFLVVSITAGLSGVAHRSSISADIAGALFDALLTGFKASVSQWRACVSACAQPGLAFLIELRCRHNRRYYYKPTDGESSAGPSGGMKCGLVSPSIETPTFVRLFGTRQNHSQIYRVTGETFLGRLKVELIC